MNPKDSFLKKMKKRLILGFLILVPVGFSFFIIITIKSWLDSFWSWIWSTLHLNQYLFNFFPFQGIVITLIIMLVFGNIFSIEIGEEAIFHKIPPTKFALNLFTRTKNWIFSVFSETKVVQAKHPHYLYLAIGFLTSVSKESFDGKTNIICSVFFPSSPIPITGPTVQLPPEEIYEIDIPVITALKYIVSAGAMAPKNWGKRKLKINCD